MSSSSVNIYSKDNNVVCSQIHHLCRLTGPKYISFQINMIYPLLIFDCDSRCVLIGITFNLSERAWERVFFYLLFFDPHLCGNG